jgi:hypothetical protein
MTNKLEDLFTLINVGMSFQDRFEFKHLSKDTSHTPHVNGRRVSFEGEQQLRRAIPPSDHETGILSYSLAIPSSWHGRRTIVMPSQTKIGNLKYPSV